MTHEVGAYLGSVRDVESLRGRCVMGSNGCWHLRTSQGRPMPRDQRHMVWVYGRGPTTATRAAWIVAGKGEPKRGQVVFRNCDSYDCVNPAHLRCGGKSEHGKAISRRGFLRGTLRRTEATRAAGVRRRKVSDELVQWIRESSQASAAAAHGAGVATSYVISIRAGKSRVDGVAGRSVFNWSAAA